MTKSPFSSPATGDGKGGHRHYEYLAEGAADPRQKLAVALIEACKGAASVVAYWASFERQRIEELAEAVPHLSGDLLAIAAVWLTCTR